MAQANPVQLQRALQGAAYPAHKHELLETARQAGAEDEVIWSLERLPDQKFRTPSDVIHAVGLLTETRH